MNLKRTVQCLKESRGFTLVELLIVIAIIGILAAAVLAALNPIEQINKGRDTRTQSQFREILNASERFWTTNEGWPWNVDCADLEAGCTTWTGAEVVDGADTTFTANAAGTWDWIFSLDIANELKQGFSDAFVDTAETNLEWLLFKEDDIDTVYMCFDPESEQFQAEADLRCDGDLATDVPAACDGSIVADDMMCIPETQ